MEFAIPRIWQTPSSHQTDCFFCMVNLRRGYNKSNYPDVPSSRAPVPHSTERPIPKKEVETSVSANTLTTVSTSTIVGTEYSESQGEGVRHYPNQTEINDLIRDLALPKWRSELLLSRLKEWNLLDESVKITSQRTRNETYSSYYASEDGICFCKDINGGYFNTFLRHERKSC